MRRLALPCLLLLAAACSSGPQSAPTAALSASVTQVRAAWRVLDLRTGAVAAMEAVPGLAADPAYRDHLVAFRLVRDLTGATGQAAGSFARQDDEPAAVAAPAPLAIAAFELTRAQWRRLAGTAPWQQLVPAPAAGGEDLPATGISFLDATAALAAWNAAHGQRLELPPADAWEIAARAGVGGPFPWGASTDVGVAAAWAVTWDTGGAAGPLPVGRRTANALGLHDVAGNAAELTADGSARGGSWADALAMARPANRLLLAADTRHAGVGLRLSFRP
ncbi:MAG: formylglycine-generating enzyme family protein [Planctomycetes bacterium]|nr:formylglycine-generating enzyme family protein [Planctomycetota bacterium]